MRVKLKDAFNLQMGKTPSRADLSLWGGNNKWISIADIGSAKKHISSTKECITDEGVSRSGIKVVPEGTVIMSFKLSIGKTAIVSEDMYTNEAIMAFIDNGTYCIDPNYLYHLCCGTDWTQGGNKAVMGLTLNKATLSEMEIELPTLEEQREIASILDQLDAIIEKRHDELNMIEQLVKSRFIELFGDTVLNPKEWPVCELSEHINFLTSGSRGWSQYFTESGEYFITIKNVKNCRITLDDVQYVVPPDNAEAKRTKVQEGDLLISITADLGRTGVVTKEIADYGGYINQHLTCIRLNQNAVRPLYVAYYMESEAGKSQFQSKNQNAVKAGLNFNSINSLRLMVPPIELQDRFISFVEQTDKSKFFACQTLSILLKLANNLQSWREKQYDY